MLRRHERIWSPALGRDMNVLAYGHYGTPLLVFPSGLGNFHDWENFGMIDALAHLIEQGKLKVYSTEINDWETWLAEWGDAGHRAWRYRCFEDYLLSNLVPAIRHDCRSGDIRIGLSGTSWGAYHAANFALKHPHVFNWALCMSGRYDLGRVMGSNYNQDCYFNDPMAYSQNLWGDPLEHIRRNTHLILTVGQGAHEGNCLPETQRLAGILGGKGVSNYLDVWGHDVEHHWHWWRKVAAHHLGLALGW
jgi:esterase/lipase superfamily enzyme